MDILIHPTYLPSIAHFVGLSQASAVTFEVCDHYEKQTYRNRAYIYAANGRLPLTIPVIHSQDNNRAYRDVEIASSESWQSHHWKSIQSAYRTSPFFEYYEDDLRPLFLEPADHLMGFHFKCLEVIGDCLQLDLPYSTTKTYTKTVSGQLDLRPLVKAKASPNYAFSKYIQVFADKHGFIENLSILDLLFNEGPNALDYLRSQQIPKL